MVLRQPQVSATRGLQAMCFKKCSVRVPVELGSRRRSLPGLKNAWHLYLMVVNILFPLICAKRRYGVLISFARSATRAKAQALEPY